MNYQLSTALSRLQTDAQRVARKDPELATFLQSLLQTMSGMAQVIDGLEKRAETAENNVIQIRRAIGQVG